jgi:Uma2 family endonuclease
MPTASPIQIPAEQHFVLPGVSWLTYVDFSDRLGEWHVRVTYDRGVMEFMTLSPEHEHVKTLLGRMLGVLAMEMDIDMASFGSMTCRREDLERGLEPDECYWIENEPTVRGRDHINLAEDPPPDLVLEVEISRSALNRMGLYAQLAVPEVWRWDGQALRVFVLMDDRYEEHPASVAFPFLPVSELTRFLALAPTMSETKVMRAFRDWVREQIAKGWPATGRQ